MGSKGINAFKFLLFVCPVLLLLIAVSAKAEYPLSYRTIDGFGNNEVNPEWGNADVPLLRIYTEASYEDGYSAPWVTGLPSARAISTTSAAVCGSPSRTAAIAAMLSARFEMYGNGCPGSTASGVSTGKIRSS